MKIILFKLWLLLVCGIPKHEGNYSVYYGKKEGENWIFKIGKLRSIFVDTLEYKGQWASHPLHDTTQRIV